MTFDYRDFRSSPAEPAVPGFRRAFHPVPVRNRHDGWTPGRQAAFIAALAESGCVSAACDHVGLSTESAYRLRGRHDATDFRLAWQQALDFAVDRLEHAVLGRAINGVAVPHYYQGAVVGEHRRYDERLALFLLRYRRPATYARHWDREKPDDFNVEQRAEHLAIGVAAVRRDASRGIFERAALKRRIDAAARAEVDAEICAADDDADDETVERAFAAAVGAADERDRYLAHLAAEAAARAAEGAGPPPVGDEIPPDVVRPSSTSTAAGHDAGPKPGERGTPPAGRLSPSAARRRKARAKRQRRQAAGRP